MSEDISELLNNEAEWAQRRAAENSANAVLPTVTPLEIPNALDIQRQNIAADSFYAQVKSSFYVNAHGIHEDSLVARRENILRQNHGKLNVYSVDYIPDKLFIRRNN